MAMRSAIRKLPALGLRSSPAAPRVGSVRGISPAAASRHLSEANFPSATGRIDSYPDLMNQMLAEYHQDRVDVQNHLANVDKTIKEICKQRADFPENMRHFYENIGARLNRRANIFLATHFGATALLVIGTIYRHS